MRTDRRFRLDEAAQKECGEAATRRLRELQADPQMRALLDEVSDQDIEEAIKLLEKRSETTL